MIYFHPLPSLTCGRATKNCFYKFCTFSGRARRSEFWYFIVTFFLLMIIPFSLAATAAYFAFKDYYNRKDEEKRKDKRKDDDDDDDLFDVLKDGVSLDFGIYIQYFAKIS